MDAHYIIKEKKKQYCYVNIIIPYFRQIFKISVFIRKKIFWLLWVFVAVCGLLSSCGAQASRCRPQTLGSWVQRCPCCSVAQSCPTLFDPMGCSTPGFPVLHCLLEFAPTLVHSISDHIQPSHPLSSFSPPVFNLSQHQGLFQWVPVCLRWPKYWNFSFSINLSN